MSRRRGRSVLTLGRLSLRSALLALAAFAYMATAGLAYLSSTGTGVASASVAKLSAPGSPTATLSGGNVRVSWKPSTIAGGPQASSYTVERYDGSGKALGEASCGTVTPAGEPASIECLDEPKAAGAFEYTVKAHYGNWSATSGFTESVTVRTSATSLTASANPTTVGSTLTYTATVEVAPVGTPGGTVEFRDGGTAISGCSAVSISGKGPYRAACTLEYAATGSHTITARYGGDGSYPASSSQALDETVDKGEQTISFSAMPNKRLGESASAAATASSGLSVSFSSTTPAECSISGSEISLKATGACTIEATQAGNADWNAATPVRQSFAIEAAATGVLTPLSPATLPAGEGPARVAVSPDGKNVYVTNALSSTVSQYTRNQSTGALTALATSSIPAENFPEEIAITTITSSYVYVTDGHSKSVSEYKRNPETGALEALATPTVTAGKDPIGIAVTPEGLSGPRNVYVADAEEEKVSEYEIEAATGELKPLETSTVAAGANAHGIIVSPDGKNVYVANYDSGTVSEYARNSTSGELTSLKEAIVSAGTNPHGLAISPDGEDVYVANGAAKGTVTMFKREAGEGSLTSIGQIAAGEYAECVVVSPDGSDVYVTNEVSNDIVEYSRSSEGGLALLSQPTVATGKGPSGIAISTDGISVYAANGGSGDVSQFSR